MATGTQTSPAGSDRSQEFVDDRLFKVRSSLQLRDIGGGLMLVFVGTLTIVLIMVALDHWVLDLGFWGRLIGFASLVSWSVVIFATRIVPPLVHSINPAYAAKVLEESDTSLKSSLLNLVFLRSKRSEMKEVVYRAVESDAVRRLAKVEVDSAVDQSQLVRAAVVLAALVIGLGIYTAVSPKNPFQTIARIAAPWLNLARPARVRIWDVQPGTTQAYFGQTLEVSARVERTTAQDDVQIIFSTVDGQHVDVRDLMEPDDSTRRYAGKIIGPDGAGIRNDLIYRIEAGDAIAGPYRIKVVPAPSFVIDRVEYEYPAYTEQSEEVIENVGDISAIEGTRVRVIASSNQPIASAYVEFDADGSGSRVRDTIPMQHEEQSAQGSFLLLLTSDRTEPAQELPTPLRESE